MRCSHARLALSARLDGESCGVDPAGLARHVAACAACREWLAAARRLDDAFAAGPRLGSPGARASGAGADITAPVVLPADGAERSPGSSSPTSPPAPDLTVAVLARLADERAAALARQRIRAERWRSVLRLAVGLSAVVQLLLALPGVLALPGIHASHEAASFDAALAIGFLLAAYRPGLARAYTPVALVFAGCLAVTGTLDIMQGRAGLAHEVAHLAAVVQAGLVWALARRSGDDKAVADALTERVAAR